jgi:hypothetical protein
MPFSRRQPELLTGAADLLSLPARAQFDGLPDPSEVGSHRAYRESYSAIFVVYSPAEADAPACLGGAAAPVWA